MARNGNEPFIDRRGALWRILQISVMCLLIACVLKACDLVERWEPLPGPAGRTR